MSEFLDCPKCRNELSVESCQALGCENGEYLDEDGINGDSWERCGDCMGTGLDRWCRECGWDDIFKCFLSPKYEQEWKAKQEADAP